MLSLEERFRLSKAENVLPLYFRMFTEISIISQLSSNRLERVLPKGMSVAQFGVLNHFSRLGGEWAPTRLARAFQVTKGAMTNTLQRLEAQGLVRIAPDGQDARAKVVTLTDAGRRMHDLCVAATASVISDIPVAVPVEGVRAVLPFLETLRKTLDENR